MTIFILELDVSPRVNLIKNAIDIKNKDADGDSYPIEIELRDSVGLNANTILKTRENLANLVLFICFMKKTQLNKYKADCRTAVTGKVRNLLKKFK